MKRQRRWLLVVVVCLLGFGGLVSSVAAQTKTLYWRRWDVLINQVDTTANRFSVTETHDIQFTSGVFRFGFRSIPINDRLDNIRNVEVYEGDVLLQASCSQRPGTYCVDYAPDELSIVYYFQREAVNERRVFTIKYVVEGPIRYYEDGDQIDWFAIAPDHAFPIESATVTVDLPQEYTPRDSDPAAAYFVPAEITRSGSKVVFRATRQINADEPFEVRVQFPHNPAGRVATWQAAFDRRAALEPVLNLLFGGGSILLLVVGSLATYYRWWAKGRDPVVGVVPKYLAEPPSDLPPAVVGTLVDEQADMRDILATLIDLARRGYLVIEEERSSGFLGIGGGPEFTFKLTGKPFDALRSYERLLLQKMFGKKTEVTLESLKNRFYKHIPRIKKALYAEVLKEGFFDADPESVRNRWVGGGVALLALAGTVAFGSLFFVTEDFLPGTLLCLPGALGVLGVVILVTGRSMPAKTARGAEEAAKWRAFREYLSNLKAYARVEDAVEQFNDYLPYAVAFGLERTWTRHFEGLESAPIPYWYYPRYMGGPWSRGYRYGEPVVDVRNPDMRGQLARPGASLDGMAGQVTTSLNAMTGGLFTMLNSASSTMSSQPSSSGGGGGFSGGFSGGGGGGGGGGAGFG